MNLRWTSLLSYSGQRVLTCKERLFLIAYFAEFDPSEPSQITELSNLLKMKKNEIGKLLSGLVAKGVFCGRTISNDKKKGRRPTCYFIAEKFLSELRCSQNPPVSSFLDRLMLHNNHKKMGRFSNEFELTAGESLLLAVLVSNMDTYGYIEGLSQSELCELTGLELVTVKSYLKKLYKKNWILHLCSGFNDPKLFGTQKSLYSLNIGKFVSAKDSHQYGVIAYLFGIRERICPRTKIGPPVILCTNLSQKEWRQITETAASVKWLDGPLNKFSKHFIFKVQRIAATMLKEYWTELTVEPEGRKISLHKAIKQFGKEISLWFKMRRLTEKQWQQLLNMVSGEENVDVFAGNDSVDRHQTQQLKQVFALIIYSITMAFELAMFARQKLSRYEKIECSKYVYSISLFPESLPTLTSDNIEFILKSRMLLTYYTHESEKPVYDVELGIFDIEASSVTTDDSLIYCGELVGLPSELLREQESMRDVVRHSLH